jgi:hypothetical protein
VCVCVCVCERERLRLMFRHEFLEVMILTFYAHI